MSVANRFGVKIDHRCLSAFHIDQDELDSLREYEKNMIDNIDFLLSQKNGKYYIKSEQYGTYVKSQNSS